MWLVDAQLIQVFAYASDVAGVREACASRAGGVNRARWNRHGNRMESTLRWLAG